MNVPLLTVMSFALLLAVAALCREVRLRHRLLNRSNEILTRPADVQRCSRSGSQSMPGYGLRVRASVRLALRHLDFHVTAREGRNHNESEEPR